MNLTIDRGNTFCKIIIFQNEIPLFQDICKVLSPRYLQKLYKQFEIKAAMCSSVVTVPLSLKKSFKKYGVKEFNSKTLIPIKNLYTTPKTLGQDRLANVIAANFLFPKENILVIDAGTCIKYDFIDNKGRYKGGNISPGLDMRFLSLNQLTNKLPLVESKNPNQLIGTSTVSALQTGVFNGIVAEMEGVANRYSYEFPNLKIILTGGNSFDFVSQLNLSIFAAADLVNIGLNEIIKFNFSE